VEKRTIIMCGYYKKVAPLQPGFVTEQCKFCNKKLVVSPLAQEQAKDFLNRGFEVNYACAPCGTPIIERSHKAGVLQRIEFNPKSLEEIADIFDKKKMN
jgi:hypothetical protein